MDWDTIATAAQTVVVLATAIFAVVALRQSVSTRRLESLFRVMEDYHSDRLRQDRRIVEKLPGKGLDRMDESVRDSYDRLVESFNKLGYLVAKRHADKREVLELYNASILANWSRLKPYVVDKRQSMAYDEYGRDFEKLAMAAREYIVRRYGQAQVDRLVTGPNHPEL